MKKFLVLSIFAIIFSSCNFEEKGEDLAGGLFAENQIVEDSYIVSPASSKTYYDTEVVSFQITHPFILTVTGVPRISIDVGGVSRFANYNSGTGTKTLTFQYTVVTGDTDSDGIESGPLIDFNGGNIQFNNGTSTTTTTTAVSSLAMNAVIIDAGVPSVTAVFPTSLPASTLYNEQVANVAVVFNDFVTVTGSPQLLLDIGGTPVLADYSVGSGGSILYFTYSITGTDVDVDGFETTSVSLNGGTIKDTAGNDALLTSVFFGNTFVLIDGDTPYVKQVIPPLDKTYKPGEAVEVSLVFTEAVDVALAIPKVDIDLGGITKELQYVLGTGTNTLLFRYIVLTGDVDSDGITIQPTINLDGATIQDPGFLNSLIVMDPPITNHVLVDATLPEVISITLPTDQTYTEGQELYFTFTYNVNVDVTGIPRVPILLNSNNPTHVYADYSAGSGTNTLIFRYVVSSGEEDLDGVEVQSPIDPNAGTIIGQNTVTANHILTTPISLIDSTNIFVDAKNPKITSIAISPNQNYLTGTDIDVTVTLHEDVIVTGLPQIALDVGDVTEYAIYNSGTSTATNIVFTYTVGAGDLDDNGIVIPTPIIDLNGGTILDTVALASELDFTAFVPDTSSINVNYDPPQILSVTPPVNQYYNEAEVLGFTVNTNVPIDVSGGVPRIELDIGGQQAFATYISGTGTTALYFALSLPQGLEDHDGITMVSPIDLNGATLRDSILNNLDLTYILPDTSAVLVDSLVPYIVTITPPAPDTYILNETIDFTLNYNENVDITGIPRVVFDVGGVTKYADYISGTGTTTLLFQYTILNADEDINGITFIGTVLDLNGATIQDIGINDSNTNLDAFTALPSMSLVFVDAVIPVITSITPPADDIYIIGEDLDFIVNFDDNVTITNTPRLAITLTTGTVYADYLSGSTTNAITYRYTVVAAKEDLDGIELVSPLDLPGGALIQDINGNDSIATFTPPVTTGILIDGIIPTVTIDATSVITNTNFTTYNISGTCSENTRLVSIDIGGVTATPTCTALAWSATIDLTAVSESANNTVADVAITADHDDAGINAAVQATDTQIKDTTLPTISTNTIAANTYIIGDTIDMVVAFSENVTPVGSESIDLTIGAATVTANQTATTANTITYSYTVLENNLDTDGIAGSAAITGGIGIVDAVGNTFGNVVPTTAFAPVLVDGVRPVITNVAIASSTYGTGDDFDITVTFDDNITFSGGPAEISLVLDTESLDPKAIVNSGSGTNTIVFRYSVTNGNNDSDGVDLEPLITLAGATAKGSDGNDAYLNLTTTNFPAVLIDAVIPTVAITSPTDLSYINIASDSGFFPITGTCDTPGFTVDIKVDGVSAPGQSAMLCDGVNFTGTIDTTGLSQGTVAFNAELTDGGANTGTSSTISIEYDTVAPIIALDVLTDVSLANNTSYTLSGTCDEDTSTINLNFGSISDSSQTCSSGTFSLSTWDVSGESDNAAITVTADFLDVAGNPATQATANVLKDTLPPTIAIVSPANLDTIGISNDSSLYAISGTCDEVAQAVTIKIDGVNATGQSIINCDGTNFTGTINTTGYADGTYALTAEFQDTIGNTGVSTTNNITKDTVLPLVAITTPADLSFINTTTDSTTFAISGTCNENAQTVVIKIDGVSATSPVGFNCDGTNFSGTIDTTGLTEATLAFSAELTDAGSNVGTSAANSVIRDVTAPVVAMLTPSDLTIIGTIDDSATYAISGSCNENGQTVSIEVDAIAAVSQAGFNCDGTNFTGTINTTGLADNTYAFTAKISDTAGNESISATNNITKDTVLPLVAITTPADLSFINTTTDSTTFAISGTCNENAQTVVIKIDGVSAISPVGFICDGTNFSGTIDTTGLTEATLAFSAELTDAGSNVGTSAANTITRDLTIPTLAIDAPAVIALVNESSYTVSGTCDEDTATVNIVLGALATTATCSSGTWSKTSWNVSTESDNAAIALTADYYDLAGNPANQATSSVLKDTVAATVALITPADSSTITSATDSVTFSVNGTCDENGQAVQVKINGTAAANPIGLNCDGTNFTGTIDTTALTYGVHSFTAELTDANGNVGVSTPHSIEKVDYNVAITTPVDISLANETAYTISGTCTSDSEAVTVTIGGIVTDTPTCSSGTFTTASLNVSSLGDSATLSVTADHGSANDSITVLKDTTIPTISLNALANINVANETTFPVTGSCSDNGENIDITIGAATSSGTCISGTFSININTSAVSDGTSIPVLADHQDAVSNDSIQASTITNKDATAPTVAITYSPNVTGANEAVYSISGSCSESGETVSVDIDGLAYSPTCSGGSWSVGPTDISSRPDSASLPITADTADSFGNPATQATTTIDKSTALPTVTISNSPDISQANLTSYTVSGTCSENGIVVTVDVGGISKSPNCSSGTWTTPSIDATGLTDGTINITADHSTATQATTNVDKDTATSTVTITSAPDISVSNESIYIASGTCSDNGVNVDVYIDSLNFLVSCPTGTWTTGMVDVSSLTDGTGLSVTADHSTATQATTTINKATATPTVSSLSVSTTLTNSADITWTLNDPGGFTIDDYTINYRVKGSPTWLTFVDAVSTVTSSQVTSLTESTTYEFRVRVEYDSGSNSEWSNTAEGETKPDDPLFGPYTAMNVGGSTDTTVVAFEDTTTITLNGGALTTLNKGQTHTFASSQFDVIDADKPIFTAGRKGSNSSSAQSANVVWNPTAWAGKSFSFNATRTNPQTLEVFAVEDTTVEVKQGSTILDSATITKGSGAILSWSVYGSYQVEATGSILAFHVSTGSGNLHDPKPLLPGHTQIIGFPSKSMILTTGSNGTNYSTFHSDSSSNSGSLNKADDITINPEGGNSQLYQGNSLLITADKKISGASFADSNGLCAAAFMPTNLMKTKYALPTNSDYIAFASKVSGTIEVRNSANALVTTLTLTRSGGASSAPYKVRMANPLQGYRFIATVPTAAWYQPNNYSGASDQDETVMYGTND